MNKIPFSVENTFLLVFVHEKPGERFIGFEVSHSKMFREQSVLHAGIKRMDHTVIAFCDNIHGDDLLTEDELRAVAELYLNGEYTTTVIDFRE